MRKHFKGYLFCVILLIIGCSSFLAFFVIDIMLFQINNTIFTAFYGYGLFPIFSLIYGWASYRKTKKVIFPNILYVLFCMTFIILFIYIGSFCISTSKDIRFSLGVIGVLTFISIIISSLMSITTSIILKLVKHNTKTEI